METKGPLIDWGNVFTVLLICVAVFAAVGIAAKISESANAKRLDRIANLTECRTCGEDVSRRATSCPHCGEPRVAY